MKRITIILICIILVSCIKEEDQNNYQSKSYNSIQEAEVDAKKGNCEAKKFLFSVYLGNRYSRKGKPLYQDNIKAFIYAKNIFCNCKNNSNENLWLGRVYSHDITNDKSYDASLNEIDNQNLALAYLHFYEAQIGFQLDTSEVLKKIETQMTEQEKSLAKLLINQSQKGECVYDNRI